MEVLTATAMAGVKTGLYLDNGDKFLTAGNKGGFYGDGDGDGARDDGLVLGRQQRGLDGGR